MQILGIISVYVFWVTHILWVVDRISLNQEWNGIKMAEEADHPCLSIHSIFISSTIISLVAHCCAQRSVFKRRASHLARTVIYITYVYIIFVI